MSRLNLISARAAGRPWPTRLRARLTTALALGVALMLLPWFGLAAPPIVAADDRVTDDASSVLTAAGVDRVTVDVGTVVRSLDHRMLGMNTNALFDTAARRAAGQGYETGLRQLGVRSLRFPGGEKSDTYLWSTPPFAAPRPTPARTGPQEWPSNDPTLMAPGGGFNASVLNFDQFMAVSQRLGAEPTVVIAFDSMYKPATPGGAAPSRQQLLDTAVAWVRYANLTTGTRVTNWEIGNESYKDAYAGGATAADYARDLILFAQAMKAVDPTIRIGANGPPSKEGRGDLDQAGAWWETVLSMAAPEIDFLAVHAYPVWDWSGYERYRTTTPALAGAADGVAAALADWAPDHAERIRIHVTEMGAADWAPAGWTGANDLGHALVLAEMIGAHLVHRQVDSAVVWNTHWSVDGAPGLWSSLDAENRLLPSGQAVAIWGQALQPELVAAAGTPMVRAFASHDPATGALSVFLINKDTAARPIALDLAGYGPAATGALWSLRGSGPADTAPSYAKLREVGLAGGTTQVELPPVSLSVLTLTPRA